MANIARMIDVGWKTLFVLLNFSLFLLLFSFVQSKDRILLDHELKQMLDELNECQRKLLELYQDEDG